MNAERRARLIRLAKKRNDKAALAILEADREWSPTDPETPIALRIISRRELVWHAAA